jgi:Ni/Fe-hydrogenase b-type cytochrome subunit
MTEPDRKTTPSTDNGTTASESGARTVYRHRISTRLWHWINAATIVILLMSGLMIFNAHPRLYWGSDGANYDPAWLEIGSTEDQAYLRVGGLTMTTSGVLGIWRDAAGNTRYTAFPGWATIPSGYDLAGARRWHLTFAWIFAVGIVLYAFWSLANGHLWRDLLPERSEIRPKHILAVIKHHATLRFPTGEAARHYNVLQKAAYLVALFGLIPLMVLTGLAMSPAMDAAWPWLLELFGGRQSARSIHFLCSWLLVLFVIVHLSMVVLAGPINGVRSMITGRFRLPKEKSL